MASTTKIRFLNTLRNVGSRIATLHLAAGSRQPPKEEGKLRLYSMEFCPFAQRARLVLKAKDIPHDIVNINLIHKPRWYFDVHPEGKVPALDTGSEIIVESTDIADYLDEKYPNPPLYPSDLAAKQHDKNLIGQMSDLTGLFSKCMYGQESKIPEEWAREFLPLVLTFERELSRRNTPYFGGYRPGMVDYMLWPWGERVEAIALRLGQKPPAVDDQFPAVQKWRKSMRQQPVCDETYHGPEKFWKAVQFRLIDIAPDYDSIL